jgi:hypothetical protein
VGEDLEKRIRRRLGNLVAAVLLQAPLDLVWSEPVLWDVQLGLRLRDRDSLRRHDANLLQVRNPVC